MHRDIGSLSVCKFYDIQDVLTRRTVLFSTFFIIYYCHYMQNTQYKNVTGSDFELCCRLLCTNFSVSNCSALAFSNQTSFIEM